MRRVTTNRHTDSREQARALYKFSGVDPESPKASALAVAEAILGKGRVRIDDFMLPAAGMLMQWPSERGWWIYIARDLPPLVRVHVIYHELGHWWVRHLGRSWQEFGEDFRGEEAYVNAMADEIMTAIDRHTAEQIASVYRELDSFFDAAKKRSRLHAADRLSLGCAP